MDELDIIWHDAIIPEANLDTDYVPRYEIIKGAKGNWEGECDPILIDTLIDTLTKMKKTCNYVEVMFHCDHHGYVLNGLEITKSTPEETKAYCSKKAKHDEKMAQIIKLRNELKKMENEII